VDSGTTVLGAIGAAAGGTPVCGVVDCEAVRVVDGGTSVSGAIGAAAGRTAVCRAVERKTGREACCTKKGSYSGDVTGD